PCKACQSLLLDKCFKAILCRPVPDDKNFIYTNHHDHNKGLGEIYAQTIRLKEIIEAPVSQYIIFKVFIVYQLLKDAKTTPCIQYAQGVLSGKYNNKVFSGLVNTMVAKLNHEEAQR
ncbi:hypothetical protein L208DRAFT_1109316, partial [Tricholoma matsutake]